ncbi:hypothetical protein [uncultured Microbacterium sp.]|uniref:hypothetical protein n=1 Tax=uncultured Microbacterium sp. TaxID=191216 RepID=UPI0035CA7581
MDARVRLAFGGAVTVAASIAVVCAVAVSNSAALADSAGVPVALARIDVPAAAPSASPSPAAQAPVAPPAVVAPAAETVPAPAPEDVAPEATPDPQPVSTPAAAEAPAPTITVGTAEQDIVAGAAKAGGWDQLVEWARSRGWTDADIARWKARHQDVLAEFEARWRAAQTPAHGAGSPSVGASRDGSKKDQSPSSPDRRG